MDEKIYVFPEKIKPLVAETPELKSATMKLFNVERTEENGKSKDGRENNGTGRNSEE